MMRTLIVAVLMLVMSSVAIAGPGPGTLRGYKLYLDKGDASMDIEADLLMKGVPAWLSGKDDKGNPCKFPFVLAWSTCSELGGVMKFPDALRLKKNWEQLSPHDRSDLVTGVYRQFQMLDLLCQIVEAQDKTDRKQNARIDALEARASVPGPQGEKGEKGDTGVTGANGADGVTGSAGPAGAAQVGTIFQLQAVRIDANMKQEVVQSTEVTETATTFGPNSPIGQGGIAVSNSVAQAMVGPIVAMGGQAGVVVQIRWSDDNRATWTEWYTLNGRDGRDGQTIVQPVPVQEQFIAPIQVPTTVERRSEVFSAPYAPISSPSVPQLAATSSTEQTEHVSVVAPMTQESDQDQRAKQVARTSGSHSPVGQGGVGQGTADAKAAVGPVTSTGGQASVANSIVINTQPSVPGAAIPATGGIRWQGSSSTSSAPVGGGTLGGMSWFTAPGGTCAPGGTPPPQPRPR